MAKGRVSVEQKPKKIAKILEEYNNKTEESYKKNELEVPERLDFQIKHFLMLVDAEKYPVEKEVTRVIRLKEIDYNSKRREMKEFLVWYENWFGKDWQGRKVSPVTDHVEGRYYEQDLEPVVERDQITGYDRTGQHEVHYIPFSKKAVDEIIAKSTYDNKSQIKFVVKTPPIRNDSFTYEQFVNSSWDECITMIMTNGGPPRYEYEKKQQEQKDAKIQQQNKQYS
jgi:hypothetical protein